MTFITILAFIMLALASYYYLTQRQRDANMKKQIAGRWGRQPGDTAEAELASIRNYYDNVRDEPAKISAVDDTTWNDLEMNRIFNRINQTLTTVGEEYLYHLLHRPVFSEKDLEERRRLIELFRKNPDNREKLQFTLARLGKVRYLNISGFFCSQDFTKLSKRKVYYLLAVLFLLSPLLFFVNAAVGTVSLALMLVVNSTVYYLRKNQIEADYAPMSYMVQIVSTAKILSRLHIPGLETCLEELGEMAARLKKIQKSSFKALYRAQDPFSEYAKALLMMELIAFEHSYNFFISYRQELRRIFEIIGFLDAMIAVASFRESAGRWCEPRIAVPGGGMKVEIKAVNLVHPLIRDPSPYSFDFNKPVLLTGSNASGKSTFIKAVAINAILAETIHTALADEFCLPQMEILTSMALRDHLEEGESYFIVELKSLKRMMDAASSRRRCLYVIDEILRGTNTIERIAASSEVLDFLGKGSGLCLAATHDLELTHILEEQYDNYHFKEEVTEDNRVVFNYLLYPGRSCTKNALKLLKIMGYGARTVDRARERSDKFAAEGVWTKV